MRYYLVKHMTSLDYASPIWETVMQVRKQPLSDARQRCLSFEVRVTPAAKVDGFRDHWGNQVNYFDLPGRTRQVQVAVESAVGLADDVESWPRGPSARVDWPSYDTAVQASGLIDMLVPSHFTAVDAEVQSSFAALGLGRDRPPLETMQRLSDLVGDHFSYQPDSTAVDSTLHTLLRQRSGVCQDFAHFTIAAARHLGMPCRYVSGYLFHRQGEDRSLHDATHAWVETWFPEVGWLGFDPTNKRRATCDHIRVAVGRDYADVPPTRGVYRGGAQEQLQVAVGVYRIPEPPPMLHTVHLPALHSGRLDGSGAGAQ
ncbi:MAG: transglutaminase family protein [Polyangiales bacterium]